MSQEIIINSTPQQIRVAVMESGQIAEIYIERTKHRGIVGNIYKGRVTRVLPGIQAAFVNIGLKKDAFLYVMDFYDNLENDDDDDASDDEKEVLQRPKNLPDASLSKICLKEINMCWFRFRRSL